MKDRNRERERERGRGGERVGERGALMYASALVRLLGVMILISGLGFGVGQPPVSVEAPLASEAAPPEIALTFRCKQRG